MTIFGVASMEPLYPAGTGFVERSLCVVDSRCGLKGEKGKVDIVIVGGVLQQYLISPSIATVLTRNETWTDSLLHGA